MTMQPVAALPTDVEAWWIDYLKAALTANPQSYTSGVVVVSKVPTTRPNRFIVVRRDGGNVSGIFDQPRVALDVWAKTDEDASDLARLVVALTFDAAGTNGCTRVRHLSGPNSVADPSGQPRRYALIEATHRVTVLGA